MSYTGAVPDTEPAGQWINQAACRADGIHPDEMFPDNSEIGIAHAKTICRPCPVQVDCVLDAIRTGDNEHGIRGGLKPCERRAMADELVRRRRAAGHTVEETEPAPKPRPVRTFQSVLEERTQPLDGGHMAWTGYRPTVVQGRKYTPWQIAFRVGYGRPPVGLVRRTCDVDGCVLPAHLMDQEQRNARKPVEEPPAVAPSGRQLASCGVGTRSGYQRHRKNGEQACDACRQANTDADNRLRRTGTTKALV